MRIHEIGNQLSESCESLSERIHQSACEAANRLRKAETELIDILQQVDQHRVFLARGHASLFLYVVKELGLSESVAYNLISVARKAREVPELKIGIQNGTITLSNARKIVPVLNRENKAMWLGKAAELSQRQLEKEVVKVRPQEATRERATYVTESRVRLELGLSEKDMLKLRRVQDLFCQSRKRAVTLEEVLVSLTHEFLNRHDPLEKARRQRVRTGLHDIKSNVNTTALKSEIETPRDMRIKEQSAQNPPDSVKTPVSLQLHTLASHVHAKGSTLSEGTTRAKGNTRFKGANGKAAASFIREPLPANALHQINLRDERRCTYTNPRGEQCKQTRWLEIHHVTPVSLGGTNTLENLSTFCSAHHKWIHFSLARIARPDSELKTSPNSTEGR